MTMTFVSPLAYLKHHNFLKKRVWLHVFFFTLRVMAEKSMSTIRYRGDIVVVVKWQNTKKSRLSPKVSYAQHSVNNCDYYRDKSQWCHGVFVPLFASTLSNFSLISCKTSSMLLISVLEFSTLLCCTCLVLLSFWLSSFAAAHLCSFVARFYL